MNPSPVAGRTPEAAIAGLSRKDSRHHIETCHGLTTSGTACRRRLPAKTARLRAALVWQGQLELLVVDNATLFLCHQHEEQATSLLEHHRSAINTNVDPGKSLENLMEELDLDEDDKSDGGSANAYQVEDYYRQQQNPEHNESNSVSNMKVRQNTDDCLPRTQNSGVKTPRPQYAMVKHRRSAARDTIAPKTLFDVLFSCLSQVEMEQPMAPRPRYMRAGANISHQNPRSTQRPQGKENHFLPVTSAPSVHTTAHYRPELAVKQKIVQQAANHDLPASHSFQHTQRQPVSRSEPCLPLWQSDSMKHWHAMSGTPPRAQSQPVTPSSFTTSGVHHHGSGRRSRWTPELPVHANNTARLCYAKLLTNMSQPPTTRDGEGFIYMFWQTDLSTTDAETNAAASLIARANSTAACDANDEEVLRRRFFQTSANSTLPEASRRKIALKIGMARNVHQRIQQWQKQCKYNIKLLKYYPDASINSGIEKVPCVRKVERLIHLHFEMLGYLVKKQCRCGTEHREWFEMPANVKIMREIDSIIRHWIAWSIDRATQQ